MTIFWTTSFIIFLFPLYLIIAGLYQKTLKFNSPHIFILALVSFIWLFFNHRELTCRTKNCIETLVNANGGSLALDEIFPATILFIIIPWFFIILRNIKNTQFISEGKI